MEQTIILCNIAETTTEQNFKVVQSSVKAKLINLNLEVRVDHILS